MDEYIIKTIILGDSGVGKTTLLYKYIYGRFMTEIISTVGVNYVSKKINLENDKIKLQVWDTAGQERFRSIIRSYYRNVAGCIILYDVTNIQSFENCGYWIDQIRAENPGVNIILVGTKNDLSDYRMVSWDDGKKFAESKNILFFELSSKSANDVNRVFEMLATTIFDAYRISIENGTEIPGVTLSIANSYLVATRRRNLTTCCYYN